MDAICAHTATVTARGNPDVAAENREHLRRAQIFTVNLLGGPGSGKTKLLDATINLLSGDLRIGAIVGGLATGAEGALLPHPNAQVVQVETGEDRPLDATLVRGAIEQLDLNALDLLFLENLNTLFGAIDSDLGQDSVAVILSVAQGQHQAEKHPRLIAMADAVILNKIDLLGLAPFDLEAFRATVRRINPAVPMFEVSALRGKQLHSWVEWVNGRIKKAVHPGTAARTNCSNWFG